MAQVVAGIACSHVPLMASERNWQRLPERERDYLRSGFDRARQMLERTETMPVEQFMKLHGVLRGLRPVDPRSTQEETR